LKFKAKRSSQNKFKKISGGENEQWTFASRSITRNQQIVRCLVIFSFPPVFREFFAVFPDKILSVTIDKRFTDETITETHIEEDSRVFPTFSNTLYSLSIIIWTA
jgi:hypothetical protein